MSRTPPLCLAVLILVGGCRSVPAPDAWLPAQTAGLTGQDAIIVLDLESGRVRRLLADPPEPYRIFRIDPAR